MGRQSKRSIAMRESHRRRREAGLASNAKLVSLADLEKKLAQLTAITTETALLFVTHAKQRRQLDT